VPRGHEQVSEVPEDPRQLGISPSAEKETELIADEAGARDWVEGRRGGAYRLAFKSMRMPGWPGSVNVGRTTITQQLGPVVTQHTEVVQEPGWRPVYRKTMHRYVVGEGEWLTIATLPVQITSSLSVEDLERWRDEVLAAVGILVAFLDERLAQRVLAEDLLLDPEIPGGDALIVDFVPRIREFPPVSRVLGAHRQVLSQLDQLDLASADPRWYGARWYLKAAQSGPTPDAIVYLWTALEALARPPYGTKLTRQQKRRSVVNWVERALGVTHLDTDELPISLGRLFGLRAEVVHGGVESPELLREGFYVLESVTRLLLRHRLGLGPEGWPLSPGVPNLRAPFRQIAAALHRFRKTEWVRG
jgi:hypothetical protein